MKITALLLTVACLSASGAGHSQSVTLDVHKAPVKKVFKEVIRQTGFSIIYDSRMFGNARPVTIKVVNASVQDVVALCLKGLSLSFTIEGNKIIIQNVSLTAKQIEKPVAVPLDVTGKVTDADDNPLQGASVKIRGTNIGANTDANGVFHLKNVDENAVLEISFVGYETQHIELKGRTIVSVSLTLAMSNLNEVVIRKGYYTTTRKLNTGSVATLGSKQIESQPVNNPLLALEGRLPGVLVTQTSGLPGAGVTVQIRGRASIGSGTEPLYIIDGVPYASNYFNLTNLSSAAPGESPFVSINPADIESIDVLKDADATAIYGSRGANGVVLITTKKAKTGKASVNVDFRSGTSEVAQRAHLMNVSQYLQMRKDAFANDNTIPTASNAPDLFTWDPNKTTDWQNLLFGRTAHFTDAQVGVSGGTSLASIYFNTGYHNETTVFAPPGLGNKRFTGKLSADLNSRNTKFNVNNSVEYAVTKNTLPRQDGTQNAYGLPPHFALYNADGTPNWNSSFVFPLAFLNESSIYKTQTIIGNSVLRYRLLPNLNIKSSFGYSRRSSDQMTLTPFSAQNPATATRSSQFGNNYVESYIIEPQLDYSYRNKLSEMSFLVGGTLQQSRVWNQSFAASGFASDASLSNLQAAATITSNNSSADYRYNSLFGRMSYNWNQKYLANLTVRRDGSSRFGPGKRFGNFGALGLGWIFSEEPIIKQHLHFLSFGKFRGSYGLTGNDQIGDYKYLTTFGSGTAYQGIGSLQPQRIVNEDFGWEVNRKLELAAELGFFNDRVNLSVSFYRNRSDNSLVFVPVPAITGFTTYQGNLPALVQNKGWEFLFNTTNVKSRNFSWSSSFNLSLNRNKLLRFPGIEKTSYANIYGVGYSLNRGKRLHFLGVDPQTGLAQFEDINKDGSISFITDGKYYDHDFNKYYGGLSNTLTFKNFQFDFSFDIMNKYGQVSFVNGILGTRQNQYEEVLNYWRKPGDVTDIPRAATVPGSLGYNSFQNWIVSDAQNDNLLYMKLRNASLRYRFSSTLLQRYHISNLDVFVIGENLFSLASFKALDPETGNFNMPPLRVITTGIRCQF